MSDGAGSAGLLLAAWPGMGSVAVLAAAHLVDQLDGELLDSLPSERWFPPHGIDIDGGLVHRSEDPRCCLYRCRGALPDASDLLVFIGQAQPETDGYGLCRELVDRAIQRGVRRFVTCAAMAGSHRPGTEPRVLAAATGAVMLEEAKRAGAQVLDEGRISGLNGLLLAAAADADCEGLCLLGEMPFYATGMPNPSAALACLHCFSEFAGVVVPYDELARQAAEIDQRLTAVVDSIARDRREGRSSGRMPRVSSSARLPAVEPETPQGIDPGLSHRIEALFAAAADNRDRAFELKELLDDHEVFERYEDRFLDLFKRTD